MIESVEVIYENIKRNTLLTDCKSGKRWYEFLLKRHPDMPKRLSENVCISRAKVIEESLYKWFDKVSEYFTFNNLLSIEPNKIFNRD